MKYGFKLSRPDQSDNNLVNYVIFTAESYEECLVWQEALSSYVIQKSSVDTVYEIKKKLG
jgi:hypothetical protein